MDLASVGRLSPRAGESGVLLGRDTDRAPVLVPLLRPEPTRVVLIGGLWVTRVVVFRCLAMGARGFVRTTDPRRWEGFGAAATGSADRVTILTARQQRPVGHAGEPVLHVADLDGHRFAELGPDDGWQTMLTVAAQLTEAAAEALASADIALLQRMWPQQAGYAATLLGVDPDIAQAVQALPDDAAVVLSRGSQRQLWLAPTGFEQQMFGPPQRV